jgi:hypothetical protein
MANIYDIGDVARVTMTFTVDDVNTDPTTITLKVKDPTGNKTTYTYALAEVTRSAAGIYYKDISIDEAGQWYYRWEGTGAVETAEENYFMVRESEFD